MVIVCSLLPGEVDHLTTWAAKHGVRDSLILTNFVSEEVLVHLYNLCDVFVFPSLYEGFGLPVLEAMSCGAPVVVSNTSSLPEITASGNGVSGGSCEISSSQAKKRRNGRRRWVT